MAWPDTRLLDLFGVELPIIQAPMANATGIDMAVAVAEAGGLGSLSMRRSHRREDRRRRRHAQVAHQEADQPQFLLPSPCRPPDAERDAAWLKRLAPYYAELGAEMPKLPLKATIVPLHRRDLCRRRAAQASRW